MIINIDEPETWTVYWRQLGRFGLKINIYDNLYHIELHA